MTVEVGRRLDSLHQQSRSALFDLRL